MRGMFQGVLQYTSQPADVVQLPLDGDWLARTLETDALLAITQIFSMSSKDIAQRL